MPSPLLLPRQLFALKMRLYRNQLRRPTRQIVAGVLAAVVGVAVVVLLAVSASRLHDLDDEYVRRVVILGGSLLSVAAFVVPMMIARSETIDPRALRGYGFRWAPIAALILVYSLVGPVLLLIPVVWAPLQVWRDDAALGVAAAAAPLLFVQGILSVRLGVAVGHALAHHPRWSRRVRVGGTILLVVWAAAFLLAALPRIAPHVSDSARPAANSLLRLSAYLHLDTVADSLEWSPFAMLWSAPSHVVFGNARGGAIALFLGAGAVLVLVVAWFAVVRYVFQPTRRIPVERRGGVPGWFRRVPSSPTGAIAARSFIYWIRDPRYRAIFGFLPVIPVVTLLAMWIGGIPFPVSVLVPLPIMMLIFASSTHNDVAWDSSAVWTHVVAQTRGTDDRVGRLVPVLVFGAVLALIGIPLTAWAHGDWNIVPAMTGVCGALLLGGVGIASGLSARFPYPASHPGDPAFQQPQVAGETGAGSQAAAFFLTLLVATPAIFTGILALVTSTEMWTWVSLGLGIAAGLITLMIGIRVGGVHFDRRGPELLAFTMRN